MPPQFPLDSFNRETRRQSAAHATEAAHLAQVRPRVSFDRVAAIQDFVQLTRYNSAIGQGVENLTISLPAGQGYPAEIVRRCLQATPNVEILVLDLPPTSPPSIFNGIRLLKLAVFSTNLPHRILVSFLNHNPTIDALVLRACGRGELCPLRGLDLPQLASLQCPSRCFTGIIFGRLNTATVNLTRLGSTSQVALRSLSTTDLSTLVMDFYPDQHDVLSQIAAVVPRLRHLKLNEKPHAQRRPDQSRRPWNDLQGWHRTLLRMPLLEELMLRTLLRLAGMQLAECGIVLGWANGTAGRATPHPTLRHIGIIQKAAVDGQQETHWSWRNGDVWEREASQAIGPNETFSSL